MNIRADLVAFFKYCRRVARATSLNPEGLTIPQGARYKGKQIQGMKVTITTQFYSETEITHFSQYVAQAAKTYLPAQIPIDITVNGANGQTQSVITRPADGGKFTAQVLNSY